MKTVTLLAALVAGALGSEEQGPYGVISDCHIESPDQLDLINGLQHTSSIDIFNEASSLADGPVVLTIRTSLEQYEQLASTLDCRIAPEAVASHAKWQADQFAKCKHALLRALPRLTLQKVAQLPPASSSHISHMPKSRRR